MRKQIIGLIKASRLIIGITFFSSLSFAQGSSNRPVGFSPSISDSAEKQEDKTFLVAGVNTAVGVGFVLASGWAKTACSSGSGAPVSPPPGTTAPSGDGCTMQTIFDMMAMGSFMQAASGLTDSLVSGLTKDKAKNKPTPGIPNLNDDSDPSSGDTVTEGFIQTPPLKLPNGQTLSSRKVNPIVELAKLEAKGYKIDKETGTITTPDGKKVSAANLSAAAQALAASDPQFKEMHEAIMAQASAGYKAIRMDADASGGGGGGGAAKASGRYVSGYSGFQFPNFGEGAPKAATVAGLTKMANGEPIGVAGDDIFKMMQRAYGTRLGNGMFIEE
jgi:hypothetical protein